MINWNDIRVEQQIAQERYQTVIESRQRPATTPLLPKLRGWLGTQLIAWGHTLQGDARPVKHFGQRSAKWGH